MAALSTTRRARFGAVLVLCLVLVSAVGGPIITATAAPQYQTHEQNQRQRHRLVITHVSGSPSWSITASGSVQLKTKTTEDTDSIRGTTAHGTVGGFAWEKNASDPRDVIYYIGDILQFDLGGTGQARVTLDGKRVTPQSLKNTPTPTSTPTPPPTRTVSSPTTTPTMMPTTTQPPTTTHTPPSNGNTATTLPGASLVDRVIYRHGGVLILVALGLVTVLYLRTR